MNALGASILAVIILIVLVAPKRWALLGMMASVLYLTQYQMVNIGGFNLFMHRFVELAAFLRVIMRRELIATKLNRIDRCFIVFYLYTTIIFVCRSSEDVAYIVGQSVDAFLCYFTFRCLITSMDEFRWFLKTFVFLLVPYISLLFREHFVRHGVFTQLGGEWELATRDDGSVRCSGSFRYASLLGTLGATFLPIYIGLSFDRRDRWLAAVGIIISVLIVWLSNSGGPLNAAVIAMVGWMMWRIRTRMRLVRWGIVVWIAVAAMVMKAPVWYLIAKVSDVTGGDGWHRSYLIDVSFRHLNQWWLAGMDTELTKNWFATVVAATGAADITNAYISFGLSSGLMSMILFIALLTISFSQLGKARAAVRDAAGKTTSTEFMLWGLGAMLAAHVATWFGVTYWDQTYMLWFMQLAVISNLSQTALDFKVASAEDPVVVVEEGQGTNSILTKNLST